MGGRTTRTQVPLYLDAEKVYILREIAARIGHTQQELLREAVDELFAKYRALPKSARRASK
jgi:hypothetical protein